MMEALTDSDTPAAVLEDLKGLTDDEKIRILPTIDGDKTVVWALDSYEQEANSVLSDHVTFQRLTTIEYEDGLRDLQLNYNWIANDLYARGHIVVEERNMMRLTRKKGYRIHFFPTPNKLRDGMFETFRSKPVLSDYPGKTNLLDSYATRLTAPLLTLLTGGGFYRDEDLLRDRMTDPIYGHVDPSPETTWVQVVQDGADFYAKNFSWLKEWNKKRNGLPPPRIFIFKMILKMLLNNTYINYENTWFFKLNKGLIRGRYINPYLAYAHDHMKRERLDAEVTSDEDNGWSDTPPWSEDETTVIKESDDEEIQAEAAEIPTNEPEIREPERNCCAGACNCVAMIDNGEEISDEALNKYFEEISDPYIK